MAYRLNSSNVVSDTIDGEVLAIRSDNGAYYSMRDSAATTWAALVQGASIDDTVAAIAAHHGVDGDVVRDQVEAFAGSLVEEALLVDDADGAATIDGLPAETAGNPWAAPTFERFTDMRDLLLFDPIHEVEPSGWPQVTRDDR